MIKKIIKKSISLLFGTGSAALSNLITVPLLISSWGMSNYGIHVSILALTMIVMTITNLQSWQGAIVRWYKESEHNKERLLSCVIQLDMFTSIIGVVALITSSAMMANYLRIDSAYVDVIKTYSLIIFMGQVGFSTIILRVTENFRKQAYAQFSYSISRVLIAIFIAKYNPTFLIGVQLLIMPYILQNIMLWFFSLGLIKQLNYKISISRLMFDYELFKYSFWVNLKAILDLPINQLDKLLVGLYLGAESTAVYDLLKKGGQIFSMVAQSVSQVSFPYFSMLISDGRTKEAYRASLKAPKKIFLPVMFLVIFAFIFKMYMMKYNVLYIKDVAVNINILIIYCALMLFSNSFIFVHVLFMSMGYIKKDVAIMLVSGCTYLILLNFLIVSNQLLGVILSLLTQVIIVVLSKVYFLNREII